MPTARGWLVGVAGLLLLAAGAAFGARMLQQIGFALVVLVLCAVAVVRLGRHDLRIARAIAPQRATAGREVTVSLRVQNAGKGSAPLLLLEDSLPARASGRSRFAVSGIEPGGWRDVTFGVTPHRRGLFKIGPLWVTVVDPFSLARVRSAIREISTFMVHPSVERLSLPRDVGERRSVTTSALRNPAGATGEEFYTMREYEQGDDLRKIHWPSTAKRGKYMIRQEETPWQTRATVIIDDRHTAHEATGDGSSFERAVEAAASVVTLYHEAGYSFRLAGAHEPGTPNGRGSAHLNRCLDLLATVKLRGEAADDPLLLARLAEIEARGLGEETLVVVGGSVDNATAVAMARCRRLFKHVALVAFPAHRFGHASTKARWEGEAHTVEIAQVLGRSGVRSLVLGPGDRLGPAWNSVSMKSRGGESTWGRRPELV